MVFGESERMSDGLPGTADRPGVGIASRRGIDIGIVDDPRGRGDEVAGAAVPPVVGAGDAGNMWR